MKRLVLLLLCFTLMKLAAAQYHEYTNVTVTVLDSFDLKRIPHHDVVFKDLSNGYVFTVLTDSNGVVNLMLVRGHKFEVHSQGHLGAETEVFYYDGRVHIIQADSAAINITLYNTAIEFYVLWTTPGVYFNKNSAELTPTAKEDLIQFIRAMSRYRLALEIAGHTDKAGDAQANFELSLKRANAVKAFLEENGKCRGRCLFWATGYGEYRPVNDCDKRKCIEEELRLNDRVTLRIIGNLK
jgi:outer membrane protein OmpA-like peptidoglycan-associated protein